jgi:DNA polymerase III, gamma/tau subunits
LRFRIRRVLSSSAVSQAAYQVIARKWRPQTFDDVVGQDHVVRTLRNAIARQRIAHAYLFCRSPRHRKNLDRAHLRQGAQLHRRS